MPWPMRRSPE